MKNVFISELVFSVDTNAHILHTVQTVYRFEWYSTLFSLRIYLVITYVLLPNLCDLCNWFCFYTVYTSFCYFLFLNALQVYFSKTYESIWGFTNLSFYFTNKKFSNYLLNVTVIHMFFNEYLKTYEYCTCLFYKISSFFCVFPCSNCVLI